MKFSLVDQSLRNLIALFIIIAFVALIFIKVTTEATVEDELVVTTSPEPRNEIGPTAPSETFDYPVVGVVASTKEITVRAKQAGVVEKVFAMEGDVLQAGAQMSVQLDPVLVARLSKQDVLNALNILEQESSLLAKKQATAEQEVNFAKVSGLASLSGVADTNELASAETKLKTTLESAAVTMPDVLRFVQDNRTLFTSESMKLYHSSVTSLYGNQPNYFSTGILYSSSGQDVFEQIQNLDEATSTEQIIAVTDLVINELKNLSVLFTESESEFLDRNNLSSTDNEYLSYNQYRSNVLALKLSLQSIKSELVGLSDGVGINSLNSKSATAISEIGLTSAEEQKSLGEMMYQKTDELTNAERSVLLAEASLGTLRAPFAGVVTEVLVEEGEYVQPGTPLFKYVGSEAQEMKVSLPEQYLAQVKVGNEFKVDNQVFGNVSRIVPVSAAGSVTVFIDLSEVVVTGKTLRGVVSIPASEKQRQIERSQLFFSNSGPYLMMMSGEKVSVRIINDAGENLVVETEREITGDLQAASGIRL